MTQRTDMEGKMEQLILWGLRRDILPGILGVPGSQIDSTAYLIDDLGADDLDLSEIAADLSERFGLPDAFDGEKVATARTIDDLARLTSDAYSAALTKAQGGAS